MNQPKENLPCEVRINDPILQMARWRLRGHLWNMSFWDFNLKLLDCRAPFVSTVASLHIFRKEEGPAECRRGVFLCTLPRRGAPSKRRGSLETRRSSGSHQPCRAISDHTDTGPFSLTSRKMLIGRGWLTAPSSGLNEDKARVDRQRPHIAITANVPVKGGKQSDLCSINFSCINKWPHVETDPQKRQLSVTGMGQGERADHSLGSESWA